MQNIISTIPYVIAAMLSFGFLVLVHELGHFTLAKINGVFVEEFAIGMGPKLFGFKKKETLYSIRLLPIGGYVKMLGENQESYDERAYINKSPLQRLSIIIAGPIMNFITAIILFTILTLSIGGYKTLVIESVEKGAPAEIAGLKTGDKITKINDIEVGKFDQVVEAIVTKKGEAVKVEVLRNGENSTMNIKPIINNKTGNYYIGVIPKLQTGVISAIGYGFDQTYNVIKLTVEFFGTLFQGKADMNGVGGPVSIVRISVAQAQLGFLNLINLMALLSVQLGFFNILPIPALDGGYIVLNLFEFITKKKPNEKIVAISVNIGFGLLMLLMLLVTMKDILNPLKF